MPEVSRFFGIVITMYIHDHGRPHFHARYGEHLAKYRIEDLELINGHLPNGRTRSFWNGRRNIGKD